MKLFSLLTSEYDHYRKSSNFSTYSSARNDEVIIIFLSLASILSSGTTFICWKHDSPLTHFFFTNVLACFQLLGLSVIFPAHFSKWKGVHAPLTMTLVALYYIEPVIDFQSNNLAIIFLILPSGYIFLLAQLEANWKVKVAFLLLFKVLLCGLLLLKIRSLSYLFLYVYFFEALMGVLIFYQNEQQLLAIFTLNHENEQEKLRWLRFMNKLPLFVIEFDSLNNKVVKFNDHMRHYLHTLRRSNQYSDNLFGSKQDVLVQNSEHKFQNYSLIELFGWIIEQNLSQVQVSFELWKKEFIITSSQLSKGRFILILQDISVNKKLQIQEISQRMVRVLYQSLTHKFMTPINSIKSILYFLKSKLREQQWKEQIETCMESVFTLEQLMQNLNDLSVCQVSRLSVKSVKTQLRQIIREAFDSFKHQIKQKGLKYDLVMSNFVPKAVKTDPSRIKQILYILIYNAIKYTSVGSITLKVDFHSLDDNDLIFITVQDTGCGMRDEIIENTFKLFNNLDQRDSVNSHGIGLGLTILNEVVKALQGRIFIKSELLMGTKIKVELPTKVIFNQHIVVEEADPNSPPDPASFTSSPYIDLNTKIKSYPSISMSQKSLFFPKVNRAQIAKNILLVDDDPLNLYALELMFQNEGVFTLEKARNGVEAVDCVKKNHYKLIVMDLNMPGMNGMEATKEIRRLGESKEVQLEGTLIYVHSAISQTIDWKSTFDGMLSKPVNIQEIRDLVHVILEQ